MGLFGNLLGRTQSVPCALADNHPVLKQIDTLFGVQVVKSAEWAQVLVPAINGAVEFLDRETAAIPGPFDISAAHYMHDAFEHALFESRAEIAHGLGRSKDIKVHLAFLAAGGQPEAFALLGVRRRIMPEVGTRAPIGDHTLRALTLSEASTRRAIRDAALAALVDGFVERVEKLRRGARMSHQEWRPFDSAAEANEHVNGDDEAQGRQLAGNLAAWLQHAEMFLRIDPEQGMTITEAGASQGAIVLPQMRTRDRRRWSVCIARLPIAEAVAAMQHETNQHRSIQI